MPEEVPQEGAPSTAGENQNTVPEESVTLKVSAPTETEETPETPEDSSETPESDAAAPEPETEPDGAYGIPQDPTDPSAGEEEGTAEVEPGPVVSNNPDGQTVTMPDGKVIHTRSHGYPISNREEEVYELTHQGDQLRYPYVPGDQEYNPYSDPKIPNSHVAQMVERDIASYAERVMTNPEARVSPQWDAFNGIYEGELDQAIASGGGSGKVQA